jgi:hypothetical protein
MNQHVQSLKKARSALVLDRQDTANRMANPTNAAASTQATYFSMLQTAIESIDRAIEDEAAIASASAAALDTIKPTESNHPD